jgi:hypothetical protein
MPVRIQRHRAKGWRMPAGAIYVGRPGRWGNPWTATQDFFHRRGLQTPGDDRPTMLPLSVMKEGMTVQMGLVALYREEIKHWPSYRRNQIIELLQGRDLVCWCPLGQPCHADVLLELANNHNGY